MQIEANVRCWHSPDQPFASAQRSMECRRRCSRLRPRQPFDDAVVESDDGRGHARLAGLAPADVADGAAIGEEIRIGCAHRSIRQHDGGVSSARAPALFR